MRMPTARVCIETTQALARLRDALATTIQLQIIMMPQHICSCTPHAHNETIIHTPTIAHTVHTSQYVHTLQL